MKRSRVASITIIAAVVLAVAGLASSPGVHSEPRIPLLVSGGGGAECDAFFIRNQCVTCHEMSGRGAQRQNLTPSGLHYLSKGLGCTAVATTVTTKDASAQGKPTPEQKNSAELVRAHFLAFNCNRCHHVDGKGMTRSNLVAYGMEMHQAGMGCIQCQNAIRVKAGHKDLLPAPHYAKE